jgi:hypothetical protein
MDVSIREDGSKRGTNLVIVLGIYAGLVWHIFFRLKLLPWSGFCTIVDAEVGPVRRDQIHKRVA